MEYRFRNVNDAFRCLVSAFADPPVGHDPAYRRWTESTSRNGPVRTILEPVTIRYDRPEQRVLFCRARDANPFFHVFESLWMLAGRNDVAPLKRYVSTIDQFSDDGLTFNGAYGYRWRNSTRRNVWVHSNEQRTIGTDQLLVIADHLRANPESRRAVLQMWNVEYDLMNIGPESAAMGYSKDVCCNTAVYFSLRTVDPPVSTDMANPVRYLDMTVTNRSNDLVWGMLGANVVHMSFLQEYMAARIGAQVGTYYQFTNNLHVYHTRKEWNPTLWAEDWLRDLYSSWAICDIPLIGEGENPDDFDTECRQFIDVDWSPASLSVPTFKSQFLERVAKPMCRAHAAYKAGLQSSAIRHTEWIDDAAWRTVCIEWINRRIEKKEK